MASMASLLEDREQNYGMGPGGFLLEPLPGFGRPLCRRVDTGVSSHACIAAFPERWLFLHGYFQKKPRSPSKLEGPLRWLWCPSKVSLTGPRCGCKAASSRFRCGVGSKRRSALGRLD
ncbi:unnamed protein product [Symbiodinium microadriaticum]|nr:unnamed protein product [Symbiodinium microadriaticum]